jgi:hypothetical protein
VLRHWRPVHHGIAGSAMPTGVPAAAVSETGLMTYQHLSRPEGVPVRAAGRWSGDPLPVRGLHQVAEHATILSVCQQPMR